MEERPIKFKLALWQLKTGNVNRLLLETCAVIAYHSLMKYICSKIISARGFVRALQKKFVQRQLLQDALQHPIKCKLCSTQTTSARSATSQKKRRLP